MIVFPLVRMLVQAKLSEYNYSESLFADSHTINNSDTYDNIVTVPFSPDCLIAPNNPMIIEKFRQLTKPTMPQDDMNYWTLTESALAQRITYGMDLALGSSSNSYWIGTTTTSDSTPSQPSKMPKFKKGDVIICKDDCNNSDDGWCVEKGEVFYVSSVVGDKYNLRVVESTDRAQKDFSIRAIKIDDQCHVYKQTHSNSYFPNLYNV